MNKWVSEWYDKCVSEGVQLFTGEKEMMVGIGLVQNLRVARE